MLKSRIIPALLLDDRGIYKTINFQNARYIGDPLNIIKIFNDKLVDEIIICNINRNKIANLDIDYLKDIFQSCRMPVCYSGSINSLDQASKLYSIGVEKLGFGNVLLEKMHLISEISKIFGSQSVVSILNLVERDRKIFLYDYRNKKIKSDIDVFSFIKQIQDLGCGEIILHFVENDGGMCGYNYQIIDKIIENIQVPLVFLGGLSSIDEILKINDIYKFKGIAGSSLFIYKGKLKSVLINYPTNLFK